MISETDFGHTANYHENGAIAALEAEVWLTCNDFSLKERQRLAREAELPLTQGPKLPPRYITDLYRQEMGLALPVVDAVKSLNTANPELDRIVVMWDIDRTIVSVDSWATPQIPRPVIEPLAWNLRDQIGTDKLAFGIFTDQKDSRANIEARVTQQFFPGIKEFFDPEFTISVSQGTFAERLFPFRNANRRPGRSLPTEQQLGIHACYFAAVARITTTDAIRELPRLYHPKLGGLAQLHVEYPNYGFVWVDDMHETTALVDPSSSHVRAVGVPPNRQLVLADDLRYLPTRKKKKELTERDGFS